MSRVKALNEALDVGARAAWELEPDLAAIYLKAIQAQCAIAVRRLTALAQGDPNHGAPVTAAKHAAWTKPDADELGLQLRQQMDERWETGEPEDVRVEAMRRVTAGGLDLFGVSFSLKNPAIRGVLAQLGRKITDITATTRVDIMRAIDTGWEKGYSIPHVADQIRAYAVDVAPGRATMIARTELIGAVNGGSHAVASIAQQWGAANGQATLLKIWLTAEDEKVRDTHVQAGEDYAAGAGVDIDDAFTVGDDELMFPGDPDGSAGEVINCRCAISYEEAEVPGGGVSDVSPDAEAIDAEATTASAATLGGTMQETWNGRALVATGAYTAGGTPVFELAEAETPRSIDGVKVLGLPDANKWTAVLCIEGIPTGDGRFLAVGSIGNRELPLTLMAMLTTDMGHDGAIIAGRIDEIDKMPAAAAQTAGLLPEREEGYPPDAVAVVGRGIFDDSWQGWEVMRLVGDRTLRGVSIDLATEADEVVELEPREGQEYGDMLYIVTEGKIMGATVCPFAAFAEATIMLEPLEAPAEAGTEEATPEADAIAAALGGQRGFRCTVNAPIILARRVVTAAARDYSSSSMIAVHPTAEQSATMGMPGGQPDHHLTLAYLPDTTGVDFAALNRVVAKVAGEHDTLEGCVGGAGYFAASTKEPAKGETPDQGLDDDEQTATTAATDAPPVADAETDADSEGEKDAPGDGSETDEPLHPHVALADVPGLGRMRAALCNALDDAGVAYAQNHDFTPHVTLAYEPTPGVPAVHLAGQPLSFSHIVVHEGLNRTAHPLRGAETGDSGVTASAAGMAPMLPPAEWFEDPLLGELTPLTITDEGRIYGHLAPWGACHVGVTDACVQPPNSPSGYALFHLGDVLCEGGELVPVGTLTLDTGHADLKLGSTAARMHYDHTGTAAADVRCGEDEHGIWYSGAIRPDLDASNVRKLRAARVSGDWRPVGGELELVAALSVNVPGFPIVRPRAAVAASGRVLALVAAGIDMRPAPEERRAMQRLLELGELVRPGFIDDRRAALGRELARP